MHPIFLPRSTYVALFALLALVYIMGLFVPLMDNDSAHHASIALHMHRTGNYVNLIDYGGVEYLDKPHLHFWLAALSYKIFGLTSFAYKFPSFLFTILGTYATYGLGQRLYNTEVGRLAALIVASAFAYILANNDVRMDAILTASIIFATWQLTAWMQEKKAVYVAGAALGLALGFCTKGHIAVFTPAVGALCYALYLRSWKAIVHPQLLLMIVLFFVFISPVVYCYYLQYDLHPEKVIRGKSGRSGVAFILWQQNFERFQGDSFGADGKNDRLFFLHSFLWAFAPWSVLAFIAFFSRFNRRTPPQEWLTPGTFAVVGLLISLSGFKLPHYLNIIFPVAAVLLAGYLFSVAEKQKTVKRLFILQIGLSGIALLLAGVVNGWMFPVQNGFVIVGFLLVAAALFVLIRNGRTAMQRLITVSVGGIMFLFFLLNANFYPQLLTYQGGIPFAAFIKDRIDPKHIYFWRNSYSSSFNYYSGGVAGFTEAALQQSAPVWVLTNAAGVPEIHKRYTVLQTHRTRDYEVTRLKFMFLNPATRDSQLGELLLLRLK